MQLEPLTDVAGKKRMIDRLFEHWQLDEAQRDALSELRESEPDLLLEIHARLRVLIPHDRDIVYSWIHLKNKIFDHKTPLEIIYDGHLNVVLAYLREASCR